MAVPDYFKSLSDLFVERNASYGDVYKKYGNTIHSIVGEIELKTPKDHGRMCMLMMCILKISRYANNFSKGGHNDSLDDLAVYAMLLKDIDNDEKTKQTKFFHGHGNIGMITEVSSVGFGEYGLQKGKIK